MTGRRRDSAGNTRRDGREIPPSGICCGHILGGIRLPALRLRNTELVEGPPVRSEGQGQTDAEAMVNRRIADPNATDVADLLIGRGVDLEARDGGTPPHVAARDEWCAVMELLFARGANLHARDDSGQAPMNPAAHRNAGTARRDSLAHGTKRDATDDAGRMPIHTAAAGDARETVSELLSLGVDPPRSAWPWMIRAESSAAAR